MVEYTRTRGPASGLLSHAESLKQPSNRVVQAGRGGPGAAPAPAPVPAPAPPAPPPAPPAPPPAAPRRAAQIDQRVGPHQ